MSKMVLRSGGAVESDGGEEENASAGSPSVKGFARYKELDGDVVWIESTEWMFLF